MSKVDWSLAKSWADRVMVGPLSGKQYWANEERRIQFSGEFDCKDDNHIREGWTTTEFKPKPWSGPEDGLPPVGLPCEAELYHGGGWIEGFVAYYGKAHFIFESSQLTVGVEISGKIRTAAFRAIKTPAQQAADKRETAIRELMDIAQVDCRVTAARLVDAGFKREVV